MPHIKQSTGKPTPAARSGTLDETFEIDRKFWDDLPYIYLSHRAIVEFCKRDKVIAKEAEEERRKRKKKNKAHRKRQKLPHRLRSLKEFAKNGGPDLSGISSYGWSESAEPCNSTSLYDRNCHNFLKLHGIAHRPHSHNRPRNYSTLQERLKETRDSVERLGPEDQAVWLKACRNFSKDRGHFDQTTGLLFGAVPETVLTYVNEPITGLDPLVEGMFQAQPDCFDCSDFYALDEHGRIANDLMNYIVPAADAYGVVPNFFVQLKLDDDAREAGKLQALHYGALGARAVQKLRFYAREADEWLDEHAYSIVAVVFTRGITIYAVHMIESENASREADYQLTQIFTSRVTDGIAQFRKAVAAFRNCREFAKDWRDYFVEEARLTLERSDCEESSQGAPIGEDRRLGEDDSEGFSVSQAEFWPLFVLKSAYFRDFRGEVAAVLPA
ncbi:uncharacterized protein BO97DRAFT_423954 [Aspergillus homomorphus CBS 101889]|uniref:Uncharacterized protein n=1 Tax=Aspergillus homomorphus (strain CBS 101889) TaxID=1450537 RepID=A0A395HZB3_ASPHC|nr:hypothetical protein BO97DRAFT_423954 [Aspergillus homomorphus CBS 101889]RAL13261.1 hypothetical protein BO97DRAFT_423954 [Aspergillus homomorphus CBS 101889]